MMAPCLGGLGRFRRGREVLFGFLLGGLLVGFCGRFLSGLFQFQHRAYLAECLEQPPLTDTSAVQRVAELPELVLLVDVAPVGRAVAVGALDEQAADVVLVEPVLVEVCVNAEHASLDRELQVILGDFFNFVLLPGDQIIKTRQLVIHVGLLTPQLFYARLEVPGLDPGGREELLLQLGDLLAAVLSVLRIGDLVALNELSFLRIESLDLAVQILLLLEVDGAVLDPTVQELPEAVEVVHEVDE